LTCKVAENGFAAPPISIAHGLAAGQLPRHHDDPFDLAADERRRNGSGTLLVARLWAREVVPEILLHQLR
jgi:PIN domain nuclease of toxin-antitoxin system